MKALFTQLWSDDGGQHLVEYAILLAWMALASTAFLMGWGKSLRGVWTAANTQLAAAKASAS